MTKEKWEEEFWKKFKNNSIQDTYPKRISDPFLCDSICDFIEDVLNQQEQEHKKQLKKIRDECVGTKYILDKKGSMYDFANNQGHNKKREEIKQIFNKYL